MKFLDKYNPFREPSHKELLAHQETNALQEIVKYEMQLSYTQKMLEYHYQRLAKAQDLMKTL
jgi:hypothetical protein